MPNGFIAKILHVKALENPESLHLQHSKIPNGSRLILVSKARIGNWYYY
jgi:hypothetical protein